VTRFRSYSIRSLGRDTRDQRELAYGVLAIQARGGTGDCRSEIYGQWYLCPIQLTLRFGYRRFVGLHHDLYAARRGSCVTAAAEQAAKAQPCLSEQNHKIVVWCSCNE